MYLLTKAALCGCFFIVPRKPPARLGVRLLTNPDDAILNGEDRQRSKASAPRMARLEPTWMYLRRLYDLPVLSVAGTLSITSPPARLGIQLEYEGAIEIVPVAIEPHADAARQNSVQNNCMNMRNGNKRPINS
ncbi:acetyltransferase [Yersinia pseudotuberculosis]|nr:acetyltransferase [Yersinia pseudotuberculosis]